MCDLHLPFDKNALQYDVLEWAVCDIKKNKPVCVVYAGDVTCDGNLDVYNYFINKMRSIDIPFYYVPGNSDLRCADSRVEIRKNASQCKNSLNGILIFAVNDCDGTISDGQLSALEEAKDDSIVFMHHPIAALSEKSRENMLKWRESHKNTVLFYGHNHKSEINADSVSLQSMDPDKAIGENPCVTYYDTDTKELRKAYYFCPVPDDLNQHFGISCYRVAEDIELAVENNLKNIELRPNCLGIDKNMLSEYIEKWRRSGGENLSIHLPDIAYKNGEVIADAHLDEYIEMAKYLKADRFTQHVPVVSVRTVTEDKNALENICTYLAERINTIEHDIVIGVENMHMTSADTPDDNRRFGYIPEECVEFMELLGSKCRHKVGINFDIGHARNNMPYSQKYQISTWFSHLGKYIVGYHIHQVTLKDGVFENHMPITEVCGHLISYCSFFRCWSEERINKAPVVFEMRPDGAYSTTLKTFKRR